ncbi:unnamed protein product [Closterium sp. NIES-53]
MTCYQSEGLGFESQYVHFGHPSAGGCQRSTGDPRLILVECWMGSICLTSLSCDVLEDMQFELEFLAVASPSLCAMLLSLEGNPDALDIPTPRTYREEVSGEWASQWKAAMDAELASWRSTCMYVDAVPSPRANLADDMWLFKVKRPPGSSSVFKAHYVARGFSQREVVDFFQTFAPTPKMTTLRVLLHVAALRDYELHSLEFSTAFL